MADGAPEVIDLVVKCRDAEWLDDTIQQLPGAQAVVDGSWDGETCRVRVFGDPGFIKFAITNQGYGEVVGEQPVGVPGATHG